MQKKNPNNMLVDWTLYIPPIFSIFNLITCEKANQRKKHRKTNARKYENPIVVNNICLFITMSLLRWYGKDLKNYCYVD